MPLNVARLPDYKDLDLDFIMHPGTKDISKKTGVEAIKRSVRNLILTNFYERPFRSHIGSNAQKLLFENVNPLTATFLQNAIRETIENFEPRVQLSNIVVKVTEDLNRYVVDLTFTINNRLEPIVTSLFLERIR